MLTDTNCALITLLQYLNDHVTALSSDSTDSLRLYVLSEENSSNESGKLESFMEYTPKQFHKECLGRKQLILVYQGAQIILGMSVYEYCFDSCHSNWSRSYIQYVDTTGLFTPRQNQSHLTKSIVKSYISYCKDILNMESVHLLATAKPSFLFAGSEFNHGKRALPAVKLINWWIGLLQSFTDSNPKTKVFVYSPAEEAEGSMRMKKRITNISSNWTYGLPYALNLPCVEQIPLFEDDPKWRHFAAIILEDEEILQKKNNKRSKIIDCAEDEMNVLKRKTSVKEFFESIQIRPEFRSEPSTFFVLRFPKKLQDCPVSNLDEFKIRNKSDLASFGMKMLSGLTFESESTAKFSSQKISGWLKLMSVPSFEIKTIDKENLLIDTKNDPIPLINSLQSFIKRKIISNQ